MTNAQVRYAVRNVCSSFLIVAAACGHGFWAGYAGFFSVIGIVLALGGDYFNLQD